MIGATVKAKTCSCMTTLPIPLVPRSPAILGGPSFDWTLSLSQLQAFLDQTSPDSEAPEYHTLKKLKSEFRRLCRHLGERPLDKSPLFAPMEREVGKFCDVVVGEWLPAKAAAVEGAGGEDADPEAVAAAVDAKKEEFFENFSLLAEREGERTVTVGDDGADGGDPTEEVEKFKYVLDVLDRKAEQRLEGAALRERMAVMRERKGLDQVVADWRNKCTTENVDVGGQVVWYEMDLSPEVVKIKWPGDHESSAAVSMAASYAGGLEAK